MPDPRMAFQPRRNPHAPRRAAGPLVIDAEATVVARAPGPWPAPAPDIGSEARPAAGTFAGRHAADIGRPRPAAAFALRHKPLPDLIFPGAVARPPVRRTQGAGLALFLRPSATGNRRIALGAAVAFAIALPAVLFGTPQALLAEPGLPGTTAADFVISEVEARIVSRGEGDVLSVEAAVRNVSASAAPVPLLRLALGGDDGATWARPVAAAGGALAAGATLRFHSAVAVPAGTGGDLSVDFMPVSPAAALR